MKYVSDPTAVPRPSGQGNEMNPPSPERIRGMVGGSKSRISLGKMCGVGGMNVNGGGATFIAFGSGLELVQKLVCYKGIPDRGPG